MNDVANTSISRRRIVQGAAWAAPAIILATAAPALAQSPTPRGTLSKSKRYQDDVEGYVRYTIRVTAIDAFDGGISLAATAATPSGDPVSIESVRIVGDDKDNWTDANPSVRANAVSQGTDLIFGFRSDLAPAALDGAIVTFALYDNENNLIATA